VRLKQFDIPKTIAEISIFGNKHGNSSASLTLN
jgi:hypothetical protein